MPEQSIPTASEIGEDRIREAFEFAASGMAITDLDGRFQETNPAYREIVGRTREDLKGESILSITHAEDRDNCRNHLDRLLSGQAPSFVLEKRYVRPDGVSVWVRNSFSLLKDDRGRPSHIILICNDITERRRAELLLVEREKLAVVGQLATSIAHEINNPLEAALQLLLSDQRIGNFGCGSTFCGAGRRRNPARRRSPATLSNSISSKRDLQQSMSFT